MTAAHPPRSVLAVDPQRSFAEAVAAALPDRNVRHASDLDVAVRSITSGNIAVVVLGPNIDFEAALALVTEARASGRGFGAVVVARRPSTAMMRQALHADVADVLPAQHDPAELVDAVTRAWPATSSPEPAVVEATPPAAPTRGGSVVTVFSAKGGCGKSVVATNVAVLAAQRGRSVCVVDLDLQFGDVAIMFQLRPSLTIGDAVHALDRPDHGTIVDFVQVHDSGVAILPAPQLPSQAEVVRPDHVERILEELRGAYDLVVVDTPAMFTDTVLAAIDASDRLVLVSGFDVASIKNLRLGLSTLQQLEVDPATTDLVVMRADAKVGLRMQEVERTIGASIDVAVPSERDVTISINHGIPLALERPKSAVVQALAGLTDSLLAATSGPEPATERAGVRSRLRGRRSAQPVRT